MSSKILGPEPYYEKQTRETLAKLDVHVEAVKDPWHKTMLANWRDHYWGEAAGDLELTMGTLAPDPIYRFNGSRVLGPPQDANTLEEVRAMYGGLIDMGYRPAGPLTDMKFAFADWGLMVQAVHTAVLPGRFLNVTGLIIDPNATYSITAGLSQSHPYDRKSGLMMGEIVFSADPTDIRRIERI
jgi:hypothetical protein